MEKIKIHTIKMMELKGTVVSGKQFWSINPHRRNANRENHLK